MLFFVDSSLEAQTSPSDADLRLVPAESQIKEKVIALALK